MNIKRSYLKKEDGLVKKVDDVVKDMGEDDRKRVVELLKDFYHYGQDVPKDIHGEPYDRKRILNEIAKYAN